MCLICYIIHVYIFFLLLSLLSLSFCVCLLAFFSSRDLVFISTFMLLCLELQGENRLNLSDCEHMYGICTSRPGPHS